ncbi:holo-ACP synthase [Acidithiobacillus caldus]|uniref:Holo-[acyl-carrier-protein] synthase n=3 Tax=Acidithiobacillus caldus TaxID=33059 RepID=F9ZRE5_ACICS|nr:holo-ACP synthase [Acidithiobacillus caldus]AEK58943.1 Holo-acyl-carrier protein synthase [Acidithiobacillus caldus SM-1]AUW33346.1 holo-ACP synthase [Acidithiobacillus caldus]MBU2762917.1 holo-ACP synthase [Acidithiobacillus caldus]MBU2772008.1 holo-ACP synthase [Acidithiobacillus caldus]MBU2782066.1 holo-ACP synthase [Acidithiobacillus caldus]
MIVGLGCDLIAVARMAALHERYGERLQQRLLAATELGELPPGPGVAAFLARRFAAKEAALKALGTGLRAGIRWVDLKVVHDSLGRPELQFAGAAQQRLRALARRPGVWLSISDERAYALATVVIEDRDPPREGVQPW